MINNNSGNRNKNVTFYRSMYIFLILLQVNVNFLLTFLSLIRVNVYFLILIQVNLYFFNSNTGQCIFFIDLFIINTSQFIFFLVLIQVNVYFFNTVLVLKKYTLTCISDKKINKNIHRPVLQ